MAGEQAQTTSQTEVAKVLDTIKREMMERRQLRAQNDTNKQLVKINKNMDRLKSGVNNKPAVPEVKIKIPSVNDFIVGFSKVSPIFSRDYSTWMKDTVQAANEGNTELERITGQISQLGDALRMPTDDTSSEYLDMISDQLKAANEDSLKRLDSQEDTLWDISGRLSRIGDTLDIIQKDNMEDMVKENHNQLVRLDSIENKLGRVGGKIVGTLIRIFDGDEKWREKEEMRRAEEGKEGRVLPRADSVVPNQGEPEPENTSGFAAALAAMLGLTALKAFLLKPFKVIGRVVGTFLGMFSKVGEGIVKLLGPFGKALKFLKVGPLALVSAVIDFGAGFLNAKDILGKGSVTVVDRVRAGVSELVGGFGDIADWIAKIFGFDTGMGKSLRDFTLMITEKPAEWLNSIVDWVSNDLFAGITKNTSLTDIPGKLADNLQTELIKLVNWITGGISSFVDEGISVANKIIGDIKTGFTENIKKPFYNMLDSLTNAMFDIVDKFVSIIPDALGGQAARQKMDEARKAMLIGQESQPDQSVVSPTPTEPGNVDRQQPRMPKDIQPPINQDAQTLTPIPQGVTSDATNVTDRNAQLKDAYGSIGGGTLGAAKPVAGRTANNVESMKSAYGQPPASVYMPVQQTVDNSKRVSNTTNMNSTNLETSNQTDKSRIMWDW